MERIGRFLTCIGVLVVFAAVLPAATLLSESFETYSTVGNIKIYDTTSLLGSGEVTAGSVDLLNNYEESATMQLVCHSGVECIDMDGSTHTLGQLTYTFTYTAGVQYSLSFWAAPGGRGTDEAMDVNFAGVTTTVNTSSISGGVAVTDWVNVLLTFTPVTSGSGTIVFTQLGNSWETPSSDNIGMLLDDVLLTDNTVPEPGTLALVAGGLALAGLLRRRRA